jgi:3-oxoacyl-[acyl-carrier-protein] synthase III
MTLFYQDQGVYVRGLNHQLARVRRDLAELAAAKLLCNSADILAGEGYRRNFGAGPDESLLSLAAGPFSEMLRTAGNPRALVFHHAFGENGTLPWGEEDPSPMSRSRYFPAALMRRLNVDDLPYFGVFAAGCAGFCAMLIEAAGLLGTEEGGSILCLTADVRPQGACFDGLRERILISDCGAGFVVGREPAGYRLLGISHYSTAREYISLVEIAKRTVQMIRALLQKEEADFKGRDVMIHYPNIFPGTWAMVTRFLGASRDQQIMEGLPERAHCLSADAIISLAKLHSGRAGRLHLVVNFGNGIHLSVCALREMAGHA